MLAISGLHIGLFSGLIFFIARGCMVLIPGFALRHPVKKYAAVLAFVAGFAYLALSGFSISAQRALIMAGIVFLAIIVDRMALTLRLVACAAILVLLLAPESLLSASFHMSFGAVVSLIVFFNALRPWWSAQYSKAGWVRRVALYFLGISLTTLIGSLATAPFALFHFQQMANFSLPANFFAVPILGFAIMPLAVLALALTPFGLDFLALGLMQLAISGVLEIAHYFAGLSHAVLRIQAVPLSVIVVFTCGVLFIFLWRGRSRFAGFALVVAAVVMASQARPYDVLVSADGKLWGITDAHAKLFVSSRNKDRFSLEAWEAAYGMEEGAAGRWPREGRLELGKDRFLFCGEKGCRFEADDRRIVFLSSADAAFEECNWATHIISSEPLPPKLCDQQKTTLIDFFDSRNGGAVGIRLGEFQAPAEFSAMLTGQRPWSLTASSR